MKGKKKYGRIEELFFISWLETVCKIFLLSIIHHEFKSFGYLVQLLS